MMLIFAIFAGIRWSETGLIFFLLLMMRDVSAAWFLISRAKDYKSSKSKIIDYFSYISCGLPLLYFGKASFIPHDLLVLSSLLAILGFTVSTLALFDLGTSFGISPANRGVVKSGIYCYFKHPMYYGYIIAELGFVMLNSLNWVLFPISVFFYLFRIKVENKILQKF
jgi:protein-S-isoprenylcysteine O-methyltransferase Ste14